MSSRRLVVPALMAVAAVGLASCLGNTVDVVSNDPGFAITPPMVVFHVGDTASVTLSYGGFANVAQTSVSWSSAAPAIAKIDSVMPADFRVRLKAVAPGTTGLGFTLTYQGQTVTGTVPVTVN